jgi:tRNA modification GTPase
METIAAIATAIGGAIATIRVSGDDAITITDRIFSTPVGGGIKEVPTRTLHYGRIFDAEGREVDEVMVSVFRAPHSYTGENSTEISCHGSRYILQRVMELLIENGARQARPGEYTQRAFMNGKMDLSQAEAVADLISASSRGAHDMAISQLNGNFSNELKRLREHLLKLTSLLELELDFSEEDVTFASRKQLTDLADTILAKIHSLVSSFRVGNALKDGIPVAIVGKTNVGKSTLLNHLLGDERAIVSPIHGTTRDIIEDTVNINGITFRFIDTAGIRATDDEIEKMGIGRTMQKMSEAAIVIWMIDEIPSDDEINDFCRVVSGKNVILAYNKCDLLHSDSGNKKSCLSHVFSDKTSSDKTFSSKSSFDKIFSGISSFDKLISDKLSANVSRISISAKFDIHLDELRTLLCQTADIPEITEHDVVVTNIRHLEALKSAGASMMSVIDGLHSNLSGDLLSEDLRQCIHELGEIVGGEITEEETLGNIFSHFCIGK